MGNAAGKGKFMQFVETHKLSESDIAQDLGDTADADDCILIDIDDDFPLKALIDGKKKFTTQRGRKSAVFKVLQRCYKYGRYGILSCYKHIDWKLYFSAKSLRAACTFDDDGECPSLARMVNALKYYSKIDL